MRQREKDSGFFDLIVYAMMIVAIVYVLIQTLLDNNNTTFYKVSLGIWILAALVISDFVEPFYMRQFEKMKQTKIQAYIQYAVADALMYALAYIFIINVSFTTEPVHYVALAAAIAMYPLRQMLFKKYQKLSGGAREIIRQLDKQRTAQRSVDAEYPDGEDFEVNTFEEDEDDIKVMIIRNRKK